MKAILCASENWGIGNGGGLLFHIRADMRFFRAQTEGGIVIMGRKTLDSFPEGRPLKNRVNIVLTHDASFAREGVIAVSCKSGALAEAKKHDGEVYIIGGGEIYSLFLEDCDRCLVTKVEARPEADVFFPNLDESPNWRIAEESELFEEDGLKFRFVTYERTR